MLQMILAHTHFPEENKGQNMLQRYQNKRTQIIDIRTQNYKVK